MQFQLIKERNEIALKSEADYVAPYLVYYAETSPDIPQSVAVYHACLDNLKKDFLEYLNELQRRYDEVNMRPRASNSSSKLIVLRFFFRAHTPSTCPRRCTSSDSSKSSRTNSTTPTISA